jgi:hypothetical protein
VRLYIHLNYSVDSVGTSHSATGAIKSALKYVSPDAHWIARRLVTAGGKLIKVRPLSTRANSYDQLPVATTCYYICETTARLRVQRSPTSKRPTTCPASAEPARALPTCTNLRSAAFTTDTTPRQPSADQLSQLPARCPPNPACCGPGNLSYTLRPLSGPPATFPANQCRPRRGSPHSIQNGPFQGLRLKQCRYRA